MKPLYEHDCSNCIFCGTVFDKDYYICPNNEDQAYTLLKRSSSEGPDYWSASISPVERDEWLRGRHPIMFAIYAQFLRDKK